MIAIAKKKPAKRSRRPDWQNRFLDMLPTIRSYARGAFGKLSPDAREDRMAEVVANTLVAFRRLVDQGREDLAYPTVLARYGIAQVRAGRTVGGHLNCKDVLSSYAQKRNGFEVERLDQPCGEGGDWAEVVVEDRRTRPADVAALRIDFAHWLRLLPLRKRRIARQLATGESTSGVAKLFGMSAARISQIRAELHDAWQQFQGEPIKRARLVAA